MTFPRPFPLLVTGLPRSGTTWLARELTRAPGVALAGREPMNPRGNQFALGGTLSTWSRLTPAADHVQQRIVRRVYRGLEPRVYSRYGLRQLTAPLPRTRLVVKDPFALLSLPFVTQATGATAVVLFRHPGALLRSYQRMGWTPAVREVQALGLTSPDQPVTPGPDSDPVSMMAWFWSACYHSVLSDLAATPGAMLIDHAELAGGGEDAMRHLMRACGIEVKQLLPSLRSNPSAFPLRVGRRKSVKPTLHNFTRTASEVADTWRDTLATADAERMEALTQTTWSVLRQSRLRVQQPLVQSDAIIEVRDQ